MVQETCKACGTVVEQGQHVFGTIDDPVARLPQRYETISITETDRSAIDVD